MIYMAVLVFVVCVVYLVFAIICPEKF